MSMNNYLAYTSYRCVAADGKEVSIPLGDDVTIPRSLFQALLTDLRDLTLANVASPWQSTLDFTIGDSAYSIVRDYATNTLTITPAVADIYAEVSTRLGTNVTAAQHAQQLVTSDAQINISAELVEKLNANVNSNPEIEEIEARLTAQRKADESQLKISDLENKLPELDAKLMDVDKLVKKQTQLQQLLAKYAHVLKPDVQTDEAKYKQEIETIRHESLQKMLHSESHTAQAEGEEPVAFFPKDGLQGKVVLFYIAITALISLATLIVTGQLGWAWLGAFLCVLQLLNLLAINKVPAAIAWTMHRKMNADESAQPVSERAPEIKSQQRLSWLEKFFIDKAWVMALQAESQSLANTMQAKLGAADTTAISEEKQKLLQEISSHKSYVEAMQGKEIPPEEYLVLRRKLERLKSETGQSGAGISMVGSFTAGKYTAAALSGSSLSLVDNTGASIGFEQLPKEDQLGLIVMARLISWQGASQLPLVFADIIGRLTVDARESFAKLLQTARAQGLSGGQVITINVTE